MNKLIILLTYLFQITYSMDIPVYIALYQKNIDVLENKLKDISNPLSVNYGKWLKTDELNKIIYPVDTDVIQVTDWLESNNITNIHNYGDSIKFTTTKNIICSIFGLEHNTVKLTGYKIPLHLRHIIKFVEMSSNHIKRITKINITTNNSTDDRYFAREPLLDLYNVREINLNKNVSGGLIEYQSNDGFTNDDLNFQQIVNKQDINNLTKVVGNNLGYDAESELDVQLISQAADGIDLWYWQSPYWLFSFAVDFYNKDDVPDIISMSWGWSESSQCDIIDCNNITSQQYVERVNNEYLKIALRGITMTVSSGDAGAPGRTNEGCDATRPINPVFPGSSPYVVSIGATYVPIDDSITKYYTTPICNRNACITSHDEKSIRFDRVGWTAGGGFDIYHKETPWWQLNAVKQYLNSGVKLPNPNNFNRNGRAYPDVSAIGHSCPTFINGELQKIDGTSCSSPVVAGLLSIINDFMWTKYNIKLGYANPLLYYIHEHCDNCFKDITDGYNWCTEDMCCVNTTDYGFNATNGYDPVSGLGTLNIGNILDFLDNLFN